MNVVGAKDEGSARIAARKFTRKIQVAGYDAAKFSEFRIVNVVGTVRTDFPISIDRLSCARAHLRYCTYEPELIP